MFQIVNWQTGAVIWTGPASSLTQAFTLALAENTNLAYAFLEGVDMNYANLTNAQLANADLSGGSFYGANFANADLQGANMQDTNCEACNFTGANCSGGSNWVNANTRGACVASANLNGAYYFFGQGQSPAVIGS